tara:strand:- start:750 stop:929 length:180 start_codon:yes stop_codon:yes gene_type:complete
MTTQQSVHKEWNEDVDFANEIIKIILVKAKQMLVHKNLNSKDLLLLTQTIKMCKQNLND